MIHVYHRVSRSSEGRFYSDAPAFYAHVAQVETDDLDDAFTLTNHIDRSWFDNATVTPLVPRARSTSVGDLFYDGERLWRVAPVGFVEINCSELFPGRSDA